MISLFLNTVSDQGTLALFSDDIVIAKKHWILEKKDSDQLLPILSELLNTAGLKKDRVERVLVTIGPGGFTSTRIGISMANAWSFAMKVPVGRVTLFDLFPFPGSLIVIAANDREAWIKKGKEEPEFVSEENLSLPSSFTFTGLLNPAWRKRLLSQGGTMLGKKEILPTPSKTLFGMDLVKPWYYKDPHITWSKKNIPCLPS